MHIIKNCRSTWLLIMLLALAPLWIVGMFDRGYWTPDEPREADIAWRMSIQVDRTLPQLADQPFLEKPPLSYWLSAASIHVFGDTAAASRVPNLLYAVVATIAIGMLVSRMAGPAPAVLAAITAGSAFTAYQVTIWLAPDAGLVAGCALSLLGLYRGYVATTGRSKLLWYTVMHIGALLGFMAKSGPGWALPGLTLLTLIVWERRWSELKSWQLWAGFGLQILTIGAWVITVWHKPQGLDALRILFWNNLAGRFTDLHATGALDYTSAHKNWPGKYFIELPYYLFPWTLLICIALWRAWSATRIKGTDGTSWRFAVAAALPFLILLSLASTARSVYAAPALLGLGVLVGLWAKDIGNSQSRLDELAVSATRYSVSTFALLMAATIGALDLAEPSALLDITLVVVVGFAFVGIRRSAASQRQHQPYASLGWSYAVYAAIIAIAGCALFPKIDQWQDLGSLAQAINRDSRGHALALLQPDETTIAMLDNRLQTPFTALDGPQQNALQRAANWLREHPDDGLMLIDLPGHAAGKLTQLLNRFRHQQAPNDGILLTLEQTNIAHLVARYELPQGRRYALVAYACNPASRHAIDPMAPAP